MNKCYYSALASSAKRGLVATLLPLLIPGLTSLVWPLHAEADAIQTVIIQSAIRKYEWTTTIAGEQRRAVIWTPLERREPAPLVVFLHGRDGDPYTGGGTAPKSESNQFFHGLWGGAYVAYAEGTNFDGNGNGWRIRFPHVHSYCGRSKDLAYFDELISHLTTSGKIDKSRIFVAGHSSGGFFTLALAELRPWIARAFAVHGAYTSYAPVKQKIKCSNSYSDGIDTGRAVLQNSTIRANPAPMLFIYGVQEDTVLDTTLMYHTDCEKFTRFQNSIIQLNRKNNSGPVDCAKHNFMTDSRRQIFARMGPKGAETQVQSHRGDHSWPPKASEWVIDYFKAQ